MFAASSAQEAGQSSVPPLLGRGEEEEEDAGEKGGPFSSRRGAITWFSEAVTKSFVFVQKSRRSAFETEEDVSSRNNNSGAWSCLSKSLRGVCIAKLR